MAGLEVNMDLILRNCNVIYPLTGQIIPGDILIKDGIINKILKAGEGEGADIVDCRGKYASYGFSDAHFHSESTMLSLANLAKILVQRGTTSLYLNPHEVANVGGLSAVKALLQQAEELPLRIYLVAPCKVPTVPKLETSGAQFGIDELNEMLSWPNTVAIGEIDAFKLITPREPYQTFIRMAHERKLAVCGSINGFRGEQLQTCFLGGITDDHESVSGAEVLEKLRYGGFLHVREGSTEHNLDEAISAALEHPHCFSQLCFCCDDRTPEDLYHKGHIDYNIRKAIAAGLDPVWAIRMATYNTALYFRQTSHHGLIAPGRTADIVLFEDLKNVTATDLFFGGKQILKDKQLLWNTPKALSLTPSAYKTINITKKFEADDLLLKIDAAHCNAANNAVVRVVQIQPGQIINKIVQAELPVINGRIIQDSAKNIQHFVLAERYRGTNGVVPAFVGGFGLLRGAFATSVSHDHHHLVSVGADIDDVAVALNRIVELGGGMVVADQGQVIAQLPLPIWGLLSEMSMEDTVAADTMVNKAVASLGCEFASRISPFAVLSLMSLPVIGEAGFSDQGLIETRNQQVLPVIVS